MNAQWYATLFCWLLAAMLTLLGFIRVAAITFIVAIAIFVSIGITSGIAVAARRWWKRGGRDMDEAIALVCKPCHGESGRCTCSRKCGDWLCGAADTGVKGWTDDEIAYLRGETDTLPAPTDIPEENPS